MGASRDKVASSGRRRPGLTRNEIVVTALRVVQEEGLEALSMRRLATEIGSGTMSLYWYVADREELVRLVGDAAFADVELSPLDAPWRDQIFSVCEAFRAVVRKHPSLVPFIASAPFGPNLRRLHNRLAQSFRSAGLSDRDAASATLAVGSMTQGFAFGYAVPIDPAQRKDMVLENHAPLSSLSPNEFPDLVDLADELLEGDEDAQFKFSLNSLLDGIEARARPSRGRPKPGI